jgi:hypothetical protein
MLRLRRRLYVEPGEMELLAAISRREGQRLRHAGGSSVPQGVILEQLGAALLELLTDPQPPVFVIGPASRRQARMVARRLVDGVREGARVYTTYGAVGHVVPATARCGASGCAARGVGRPVS